MMKTLPIPAFFDPDKVGQLWRVLYEERATQAKAWAEKYNISLATDDKKKIALLLVDVQNTFCLPDFELYVGGRSGTGAVDDNRRLAEFIYRNLGQITEISLTMDTHQSLQLFHAAFLVDENGNHPPAYTMLSVDDIRSEKWHFNPALADGFALTPEKGQEILVHYAEELARKDKYAWAIWPYHAMLGGVGHAIVPVIEEAVFFYGIARSTQPEFNLKGDAPFSEHYSALSAEVLEGPDGEILGERDMQLVDHLEDVDMLIIAGQAKSHCVAFTVADLLSGIQQVNPKLAEKIYLLEDCTSPVVVPGADFTEQADTAYARFAEAGMKIVRSTEPIQNW